MARAKRASKLAPESSGARKEWKCCGNAPFAPSVMALAGIAAILLLSTIFLYFDSQSKSKELLLLGRDYIDLGSINMACQFKLKGTESELAASARTVENCSQNSSKYFGFLMECQKKMSTYPTEIYTNSERKFMMGYPVGWIYFENMKWANVNDTSLVYLLKQDGSQFPPRIIIDANQTGRSLDDEIRVTSERYNDPERNPFMNFELNEEKEFLFNNMRGHVFDYTYSEPSFPDLTLRRYHIIFAYGGYTYRMDVIADDSTYDEVGEALGRMIYSFRFSPEII